MSPRTEERPLDTTGASHLRERSDDVRLALFGSDSERPEVAK